MRSVTFQILNAKCKVFLLFICFIAIYPIQAQNIKTSEETLLKPRFYEIEVKMGKMVPTSPRFAPSGTLSSILFSFGTLQQDPQNLWARFHQFPFTGITIGLTNLGESNIYGYELKVIPYVEYVIGKQISYRPTLKIGLGASYTTQYFRKNEQNIALGAPVNWAFELTLKQNILTTKYGIVRIGAGYIHSSDGHTQLPNMGINGLVGQISFLQVDRRNGFDPKRRLETPNIKKEIYYFTQINPIIGVHELGGPLGPVGGPKRAVFGSNFMTGLVLNRGFKFYIGFGYRYYEHFDYVYQHDQHPDIEKYSSRLAFASNFYIINGIELIYGHFGFTFEGGLNLYKPFYKAYCDLYSPENPTKYKLKKNLNSRIGIKAYLFNINDMPKYNWFIGAHVNANLGQADFTEISFGFLRNWKQKK